MDQLITSRLNKQQQVTYLEDLSPQKFGRSAYANLSYTPSKLSSNVLYKETIHMRKNEQNGSKIREYETLNQMLKDKLKHLQSQKEGIQQSLSQQIGMYKRMLVEMEQTQEQRVRHLQSVFNEEMQKIIIQKEEQAKYVQSQKELLQNRIFELEDIIAQMKQQFAKRVAIYDQLSKEQQKLQIRLKSAEGRIIDTQKRLNIQKEKAQAQIEQLNKKIFTMQGDFKNTLQKMNMEKQRQLENLQRFHRSELQKIEARRLHQLTLKNQELKDLVFSFESEGKRLNQAISKQNQYIQTLNQNLSQEKQKILQITRQFTIQIGSLTNEKANLSELCQNLKSLLQIQRQEVKKTKNAESQTKDFLQGQINKLKKQYELTELAFKKERQRLFFENDDMKKEIAILRKHTQANKKITEQNAYLCSEIRNLKDLLLETSVEMQRIKDQFIRIANEKQNLIIKLKELDLENDTLHRIIIQKEEEVCGWRQSYYKYRR